MSFVLTAPEAVAAAADNLAGIGTTLRQATEAAASSTGSVAAAAADEVSVAISRLFGAYGQEFQALGAQAAAFHAGFVGLVNSGAAAYLGADIANAAATANAADSILTPILGGGSLGPVVGGGSGSGGILGGLESAFGGLTTTFGASPFGPIIGSAGQQIGAVASRFLNAFISGDPNAVIPGWFGGGGTAGAGADPWQALFTNTGTNLQTTFTAWSADPFPALRQIAANQSGYAQLISTTFANGVRDFPAGIPVAQAQVQAAIESTAGFNPAAFLQWYAAKQAGYGQITSTALAGALQEVQARIPAFSGDLVRAGQAWTSGDFRGAVHAVPQAAVDLFLSGVNISNLSSIQVQGPAGHLLPLLNVTSEQTQLQIGLLPTGSTVQHMAQNVVNGTSALATSVGLAFIGPPIATMDGIATGLTAVGTAVNSGNPVATARALFDLPAHALNGFLNGNTIVDVTVPVTETVDFPAFPPFFSGPVSIGANTPVTVHMPFKGILAQPEPISATLQVNTGLTTVPVTITIDDFQVGGLLPALLVYGPKQVAEAMSPGYTGSGFSFSGFSF